MDNTDASANGYCSRETKSAKQVIYWSLAWGLSVALGSVGAKFLMPSEPLFGIFALIIHVGIGLGAVKAYIKWLKALDEMQRKIQLESLAIAFGLLWIAFGSMLILHAAGLIYIDHWEVSLLTVFAALGMSVGQIIGTLKHR